MKAYYSINTPGTYYMCQDEICEELQFSEALALVSSKEERDFVMSLSSEWRPLPDYPAVSSVVASFAPAAKKQHHLREVKPLTFNLASLIEAAMGNK